MSSAKPIPWIIPSYFAGTLFLNIISKRINKSLPPSRAGMGKRLNIPRFTVIRAIIGRIFLRLYFAALPMATVTPTGPDIALIPYLPEIRSISENQITRR